VYGKGRKVKFRGIEYLWDDYSRIKVITIFNKPNIGPLFFVNNREYFVVACY